MSRIYGASSMVLLERWFIRSCFGKADCVIVQHHGQKEILNKKNIESIVFPNIIDTSAFKTDHLNPERKDFVYVGSLDKRKGFADFFKIVQLSPKLTI